MQLLVDYIPIVVFIVAYFLKDIYFATAVLMGTMPLILLVQWALTKKLNRIYAASTVLVLILGTATLFFHNPLFLFWKPTVLNWVIGLVFLGSLWIGDKPIIQRMLGNAATLSAPQWRTLNLIWVGFFIFVGVVNIYVAYNFSEAFWVNFKLFGMLGLTLVFIIIQSLWLSSAMKNDETLDNNTEN
ncbi:septation protein A [Woeseia oceani]|uniref:Inner membrane-spanning protein YciB n=1 Tax=Woeseia oceani TaxID=1548547 RepID=A0A193LG90_9GAMM|nr:septation protein A [Woeseia oceani]ANO51476.1 hypothetical protein BA177_09925 [Woeseia oceani]